MNYVNRCHVIIDKTKFERGHALRNSGMHGRVLVVSDSRYLSTYMYLHTMESYIGFKFLRFQRSTVLRGGCGGGVGVTEYFFLNTLESRNLTLGFSALIDEAVRDDYRAKFTQRRARRSFRHNSPSFNIIYSPVNCPSKFTLLP